jgi:hypothetical protein
LRNKADFESSVVSGFRRGFGDLGGQPFGLEALEIREAAAEGALGGVQAALEAMEELVVHAIGLAERPFHRLERRVLFIVVVQIWFSTRRRRPKLPDGGDASIEEVTLFGSLALEAGVVFVHEFLQFGGIFIRDESRLRVDAGLQCVVKLARPQTW